METPMNFFRRGGQALIDSRQPQQPVAQPAQPFYNPNTMGQINPYYTQQHPLDALAPMLMYQHFKQTGQVPAQQSSFQPFSPSNHSAPVAPAAPSATRPTIGGK